MDIVIHGTLTLLHRIRDGLLLLVIFIGIGIHPLPPSVNLVLLGDVMLGRGVARAHAVIPEQDRGNQGFLPGRSSVDEPTWDLAFKDLASYLKRSDLSLANLESPLTEHELDLNDEDAELKYNLCAPAESLRALSLVGMDVLTLANNHNSDCEIREYEANLDKVNGVDETTYILNEYGMSVVPGYQILWKDVNTLHLALVAFDDVSSPLDVNAAIEIIRLARQSGGVVIVSIHWGEEYDSTPNARQEMLAKAMADAGALLIWGHHPHVLQKIIWIQGNGQPFRTLVAYSLGNALFDQVVPMDVNRSALLKVKLNSYGIETIEPVPFIIDPHQGVVHLANEDVERIVLERLDIPDQISHP